MVQKVMHGKYRDSVDVAIKMMKENSMSENDFLAEAKTMTSVVFSLKNVKL